MLTVVVFYTSTKITTIECDAAFTAMAPVLTAHSVILNTIFYIKVDEYQEDNGI